MKEQSIKVLVNHLEGLRAIGKYIQADKDEFPSLVEFSKQFVELKQRLRELALIKQWLQSLNVEMKFPQIPEDNDIELWQLEALVSDLTDDIELKQEAINTLAFFLLRKSSLFEAISQQYRRKLNKNSMNMKDIENLVQEVIVFLEKIMDVDKLYLSDFQLVHEITHQLRNSFAEEMNIVSEFFKMNKYTDEDAKKRIDLLRSTLELLQFSKELPSMIYCLEHYGLCESDISQVEKFVKDLQKASEIKLSNVPVILENVYKCVGGLKAIHMRFFQALIEAQEVVDFIGQQKVKSAGK